jgi:hypothetical protein
MGVVKGYHDPACSWLCAPIPAWSITPSELHPLSPLIALQVQHIMDDRGADEMLMLMHQWYGS